MRQFFAVFLVALVNFCALINGFTPLIPTHGYTYTIEAAREKAWPSCPYRFVSYSSTTSTVDLWNGAGENQHWQFLDSGRGDSTFYLKTANGGNRYLSYSGDCDSHVVDLWSAAGINQLFRFVSQGNTEFQYYIEAVGRSSCPYKYVSFPVGCTTSSPDKLDLWNAAGADQRFRIYPISSISPATHKAGTSLRVPTPYVWKPATGANYFIQCTGGGLLLGSSADLNPATSQFHYVGDCLGGSPTGWAAESAFNSRWAPENYETPDGKDNYLFFSDTQPDGLHRLGWVLSTSGAAVGQYNKYSPSYLNLGMAAGGDIDSTIFRDANNGKTYIVWKTDDNNVGSATTRIWAQELVFANQTVTQVGSPRVIMDSTGLWWAVSFIDGGSLVEGPEVVQRGGYYYLFFAAGRYCSDFYTEGVARSTSFFGPYEKMTSPVLTNGIVGVAQHPTTGVTDQLVGPGHATYVQTATGDWRIVYHASIGENCDRYSFISELVFGADGWPNVNL